MRGLLTLSIVLAAMGPLAGTLRADRQRITVTSDRFPSGGKSVKEDCYRPAAPEHYPIVLVLHGAGGIFFDGPEMRRMARRLAEAGMEARVIHYFDGSGVAFTPSDRVLRAHHDEWLKVVRDAVDQASGITVPDIDRITPVMIYGYSMGAFLGVEASSDNRSVVALAEQAGGDWDNQTNRVGRMPPVLMIHGREDRRVPFEKYAVPLEKLLIRRGTIPETRFVSGERHVFSPAAQAKVRETVVEFFRRHSAGAKAFKFSGKPGHHRGSATNHW